MTSTLSRSLRAKILEPGKYVYRGFVIERRGSGIYETWCMDPVNPDEARLIISSEYTLRRARKAIDRAYESATT